MKRLLLVILFLAILLMIPAVSADSITGSRAVTCSGPSGILIPLGFENVMPLAQARIWYNWICVIVILPFAAMASKQNYHQFVIAIPVIAAFLAGFGWLNTGASMTTTIGIIIASGFLGAAIYAKTVLRLTYGYGGPGSTLLTIVSFMIILSAVVGLVNGSAIWKDNVGVQPNQFTNVNLESEVTQMSNTGGWLDDIINAGTAFTTAAIASVKVFLSILLSVGAFSAALLLIYPWLSDSVFTIGLLAIFQTMIWILYAKFINDFFYIKSYLATEF